MAPDPPARKEPEDMSAALALGVGAAAVLLRLAKRSGWAARLGKALEPQAGEPVVRLAAGQAALESSRYHEAAAHCEAAIAAIDPRVAGADVLRAHALLGLGLARYHLHDHEASGAAFAEAHRVQPAWPYPLANLARVAAAQDRFDEMRERLEQAIPLIHRQDHYLVTKLASEEVFAEHLDEVLELLVAHQLLSPRDYTQRLRAWQQGTLELASQDIHVDISGTVGAFTLGANSPVDGTTVDLE
jgi:tetratricopeptide (TPR) repeat protein